MLNTTKGKYQKSNTTYTNVASPETSGDSKQIVNIFEDDGIFKYQLEDGEPAKEIKTNFDVVIKTQAEFENLIASPTWLDARSVLFDGTNGFFSKFNNVNGTGIEVPNNVGEIYGINGARISVSDFIYSETNPAALFFLAGVAYESQIFNLSVSCSADSSSTQASAFYGFTKLINCKSSCTGDVANTYAYNNCKQLLNCHGSSQYFVTPQAGNHTAFYECEQLTNCIADSRGENSFGYVNCKKGTCNSVYLLTTTRVYNCIEWDSETNDLGFFYIVSKKIVLWSGNESFAYNSEITANLELFYELGEGDIIEIHCSSGSSAYSYIFTGKVTSTGSALTFKGNVVFGNLAMHRLVAECEFSNLGTLKVSDLIAIENFNGTGTSLSGSVTKVYKIIE